MTEARNLLIEVGTEELPPLALPRLLAAFESAVLKGLADLGFVDLQSRRYASPRRLAVLLEKLPVKQAEQLIERRGPALKAAFDSEGQPTKAAQGFAASCGVAVEQLERLETDKGVWLFYKSTAPGKETRDCIINIVEQALAALPIPKRMRWGAGEAEFVRPIHWLVLLFGGEVIHGEVMGIKAGRDSRGHRFHHTGTLPIGLAEDYEKKLVNEGYVIADFTQRREKIKQQVLAAATDLGGKVDIDADAALLDEVTALVEWPVPVVCSFEEHFLDVPAEALVSTMKGNQKYFPVYKENGELSANFIVISNLDSTDPDKVREGNERVVRPRLADADFFWKQDRKQPLADYNERLKTVVFQNKLGTVFDKVSRIAALSRIVAEQINADADIAARAGLLCKADLMTAMVGEFPKLQGIMGRYYATHSQEPAAVATAIEEHYWPRYAGDNLPQTAAGQCVAIADKVDTLAGIFAAGQKPSGEKDPFALRRAALGLLRIIIDSDLSLDLRELISAAAQQFAKTVKANTVIDEVFDFVMNRLRAEYEDAGFTPQQIEAVMSCRPTRPLDFDKRIRAVKVFSDMPEADSLSAANKRIANILKKAKQKPQGGVDKALLQDAAEATLYQIMQSVLPEVAPLCEAGGYEQALVKLAGLRDAVDAFFDSVMVMTEDAALRQNRLLLLQQLHTAFVQVADIACLQK